MIRFRDEGEKVKQGFNLYPPGSKHSFGFIFKLFKTAYMVRYSKLRKQWFFHKLIAKNDHIV